jgi:hypothetical protein
MSGSALSPSELLQYTRDGFIIKPKLFDTEEIDLLGRAAREDRVLDQKSFGYADGVGGRVRLALWSEPGDTIYGAFARCRRIVCTMEALLEGPVGHYHSKMIMKDARVGGAWSWHQDYAYWYTAGYLFPRLASVMIAVDPATEENGCLQVIRGSHLLGRIDHTGTSSHEQIAADPVRIEALLKLQNRVYCRLEPGDALFFDCNTLHASDRNESKNPRWAMVCCYNRIGNDPLSDPLHPNGYQAIEPLDDAAIKSAGMSRFGESQRSGDFLELAR